MFFFFFFLLEINEIKRVKSMRFSRKSLFKRRRNLSVKKLNDKFHDRHEQSCLKFLCV